MKRFQVSSVELGDDGASNLGKHMANGSPVAGAGEVQLNAFNLLANETPPTGAGAFAMAGTSSTTNGTDGATGLQRKFSIQQLTRYI